MSPISVKGTILQRFNNVDLSRGILRSLRHRFYTDHPEAFPYMSVKAFMASLDLPQDYMHAGTYPEDRTLVWTNFLQGLTHDRGHWFITQSDSKEIDELGFLLPGQSTRSTLWKIPVERDLNDDLDEDEMPNGVLKVRKPHGDEFAPFDHFGPPDYYQGLVYIPFEAHGFGYLPKIIVFDGATLGYFAAANLSDQGNNHASWCAVNPTNGLLYSSGDLSEARLHVYRRELGDHALTLHYLGRFALYDEYGASINLPAVQGGTFTQDGQLYLIVEADGDDDGVYGFDMVTGRKTFFKHIGRKGDEEFEGLTVWDLPWGTAPHVLGQLHVFRRSIDNFSYDDVFFEHFWEIRGHSLALERPRIVRPQASSGQDLSDHYALATSITFSYRGNPRGAGQPTPIRTREFTLLTYNIAQVPEPAYEGGRDRYDNIRDIARHLNDGMYGIVCIQEAFHNATRETLIELVATNYPYQVLGPQGAAYEQDGGLLMLSRFPIISHHVDEFVNKGSGLESLAAKGILHARIQLGSEPYEAIDVFTLHTRSGGERSDKFTRASQLIEAREFIKLHRTQGSWLLAGDLNVIGDRQQPIISDIESGDYPDMASEYDGMMSILYPLDAVDSWTAFYALDHQPGYTYDSQVNDFPPGESGRERLDYILVPRNATLSTG